LPSQQDTDRWLDTVFRAKDRATLKNAYDQWAATYDSDLLLTGYLHLPVIIGLVCRHVKRRDAAILDAGVGTGMAGSLLNLLGYNNLTGLDMSDGMLAKAAERKCYSDLRKGVLGEPLDFVDRSFDAVISTGTFTQGHAPAGGLSELTRVLEKDGLLMFTVGSIVWEEQGFATKIASLVAAGQLAPVETTPEYSPMPFSPAESSFTTRAHIYRKTA
jgi:predicted TPR repeat methyltransferase